MTQAEDIQAADTENKAWAEACCSRRRSERSRAPADTTDLSPESDVHGITLRLLGGVEDVLGGLASVRVLNRRRHSGEYTEVVEASLAARNPILREWIAGLEVDPASNQLRLGPAQAADQNIAHIQASARRDHELQVHAIGLRRRRGREFEPRPRIAIVEV